ncbi:MAG TPA: M14 family zinc carboxypeptidase [Candidatus Limnocylindrales bacterium]|nr:M14 family zinc carboxypeptidase [Candidatus Limnocylindrales bacterium]
MPRRFLVPVLTVVIALSVGPAAPIVAAAPACDPFLTPGTYDPDIPTFDFGGAQMTVEEINDYLAAVDDATNRVFTAQAATSVGPPPLPINYAVVGDPDRLTADGLAAVKAGVAVLGDPLADEAEVEAAIESTPVILWVAGNVHGGEESGADASLHALYELAARSDCVVEEILANALVVIMPTQNPDGRTIGQRRNFNGFDMNRDWFARTQPETDGKLDVVREYPPQLFLDVHEFGLADYFFPPNADPIYHEIPDQANDWINNLYSPAIAAEFERQGIEFFHGAPYDFFATVFGDTVPATAYHAAGMTLEKQSSDPIVEREHEHFTSIWASLAFGASERAEILGDWHQSWVDAYQEGVDGVLEPNAVFEPRHKLLQEVPDLTVRGYFLRDDPDRAYELDLLVRRLQRMGVEVRRLTAPLALSDFHPYGDPAGAATLPTGTYWITLAQAKKHWIQSMLNEDTWIPFDVTFDVTAWSNPLLMNLDGGWTGEIVSPSSEVVAPVAAPAWGLTAPDDLDVLLLENERSTRGFEAAGHAAYLFRDVWGLPFDHSTIADLDPTSLAGYDVVVLPDGFPNYALQDLGAKGKKELRQWVNDGGRIVAWQGGAVVAAKAGISTAQFSTSNSSTSGALLRVAVDDASPVAHGVGDLDWVMYEDDRVMKPGLGSVVATFPAATDDAFATSGLTLGIGALAGTAAVADEAVGADGGRVVSFSVDPNFRAWSQGTQRLLWNAIVGPNPAGVGAAPLAGSRERAAAERAAQDAAAAVVEYGSAIRIRVAADDAAATAKTLNRHGAEVARIDLGGEVLFLVANRKDLSFEEHPYFGTVVRELVRAGIDIVAASLP